MNLIEITNQYTLEEKIRSAVHRQKKTLILYSKWTKISALGTKIRTRRAPFPCKLIYYKNPNAQHISKTLIQNKRFVVTSSVVVRFHIVDLRWLRLVKTPISDFVRKNASGTLSFPQCRAGGRKKETLKSTLFKKMEPLPTLTHHHKNQQRGAPTFTFFSFETRQKLRSFIYWNNLIFCLLFTFTFYKKLVRKESTHPCLPRED